MWNEPTFLWNELTIDWNDLTIDWNDLTMERNDRMIYVHELKVKLLKSKFESCPLSSCS